MQLEWWYWILAGFCLIGLELIVPSFTIIWFGVGALLVGVLKAIWPGFSVVGQILLWSIASIWFTTLWFKYLRTKNSADATLSGEGIVGQIGFITSATISNHGKGIVKFNIPMLGADEWSCRSEQVLHVGDTVRVNGIEGQIFNVTKI